MCVGVLMGLGWRVCSGIEIYIRCTIVRVHIAHVGRRTV